MKPFDASFDIEHLLFDFHGSHIVRRYNDIKNIFKNIDENLEKENPVIYEVFEASIPQKEGELMFLITVLHPGKVKDEFFMTKGHYHEIENTSEVYLGIKGKGLVLCQTKDGEFSAVSIEPHRVVYIPPCWAHRTVNISNESLIFFGVYPAHAGHDYKTIEETGFLKRIFYKEGEVKIIDDI